MYLIMYMQIYVKVIVAQVLKNGYWLLWVRGLFVIANAILHEY